MDRIIAITTVAVLLAAVYTDVRQGKIYNVLTLPAILAGLALNALHAGTDGVLASLGGIAVVFALFLFTSLFGRIIGGGDIKLLGAIGALQGPAFIVCALACTMLIGGVLALVVALSRGILAQRVRLLITACHARVFAHLPMSMSPGGSGAPRLPYAVAICLGTFAAFAYLGL